MSYVRPSTLDEALELLARGRRRILGGGTDIFPQRTQQGVWGAAGQEDILDLSGISSLRGIAREGDIWRIGALATWRDVLDAALPPLFDGLKAAARAVGGVQVQNRGTLAGNICNASPAADGVPCLLALDAVVVCMSRRGARRVPLTHFIDGYRKTALAGGEIVTAIEVPHRERAVSGFLKLGAREHLVISIAMAAGVLEVDEGGRITAARIAIGACSPVALRLTTLERDLIGRARGDDLAALVTNAHLAGLSPVDDVRASADYRRSAARTLTADLLMQLSGRGA